MKREMLLIDSEVKDTTTAATEAKRTFAAKWLNRAFRLCVAWNIITAGTILAQVIIFFITENTDMVIPGQGYIYGGATLINAALVGGDMIVDKLTERLPVPVPVPGSVLKKATPLEPVNYGEGEELIDGQGN